MLKSTIGDFKKIKWRHFFQSILLFTCFSTIDTVLTETYVPWLIAAGLTCLVILIAGLFFDRIRLGRWSECLNLSAAACCVGGYFLPWLLIAALPLITAATAIRLVYARKALDNRGSFIFILGSLLCGLALRYALILLPLWAVGGMMLLSGGNPRVDKDSRIATKEQRPSKRSLSANVIIMIIMLLVGFYFCAGLFGGLLNKGISESVHPEVVNVIYLVGFILFMAAILIFPIKYVSIVLILSGTVGMFFFLIPNLSWLGIYSLLFIGGGMESAIVALPNEILSQRHKNMGGMLGLLFVRTSLWLRVLANSFYGDEFQLTSGTTYVFIAIMIVLGSALVFFLFYWQHHELQSLANDRKGNEELPSVLTIREKEIALLILDGKNAEEIARRLFISVTTVRTHIAHILEKSGMDTQKAFIIKYK